MNDETDLRRHVLDDGSSFHSQPSKCVLELASLVIKIVGSTEHKHNDDQPSSITPKS